MLENHAVGKCIINIKLAVYTGLYQMINPDSPTILGYNTYHVCVIAYLGFIAIMLITIPFGLYHWTNDRSQFIMGLILLGNYVFSCYKIINIIQNSKKIWKCLDVSLINFMTSYDKHDYSELNKCMIRTFKITYTYSIFCYILLISFYLVPFALNNARMTIKQRDGTYLNYRVNVHNLYMPVSVETYDEYFTYFYVLEVAFGFCYIVFTVMFDNFLVSMCLAITCQIETISNSFLSLGYGSTKIPTNGIGKFRRMKFSSTVFIELKMLTKDYQKVLKRLQDYYSIVHPVILTQLAVDSVTLILISLIIALNVSRGGNESATSIQTLKMISVAPVCVFHILSACYLFGSIHDKIGSTNLAVYSSNWTEMDLQFKQLILLKMKLNNAIRMQLKVTVMKVINLEMFISVMHLCYSIISVILKTGLSSTN